MSRFLQLHLLTSYPPANLNRDDMGRPKTAKMGGVDRLRVSSQSLKRTWRTSEIFSNTIAGPLGDRTKKLGVEIFIYLMSKGFKFNKSLEAARTVASVFGKNESPVDLKKKMNR